MQISEIMSRDVQFTDRNATLEDAARLMSQFDIGALPVGENEQLLGIVTDRDLVTRGIAAGLDPKTASVGDIMTGAVNYCYDNDEVEEVAEKMAELQLRRMLVVDRDSHLVGIVSLGDLARETDADLSGRALEAVSQAPPKLDAAEP